MESESIKKQLQNQIYMEEAPIIILAVCFLIALVIVMRYIGAWMFRIDELIKEQKRTNQILAKTHGFDISDWK